jgi:hypothetical protein
MPKIAKLFLERFYEKHPPALYSKEQFVNHLLWHLENEGLMICVKPPSNAETQ